MALQKLKEYKDDSNFFDKEVFPVLKGKKSELVWYVFEQKVREIIAESLVNTDKRENDIMSRFIEITETLEK